MPVRAIIVDDEPGGREAVATLLAAFPQVDVVGEASNGNAAVELVRRARPDLMFLDVQMPDRDGFAVLEALGDDVPRGVVFVTAHDQHAIRAFEVHALDYVLKPFGRPRFAAAVHRALDRLDAIDALSMRRTLARMAGDRRAPVEAAGDLAAASGGARESDRPRRIGVRVGVRTVLINVEDIDWVEADGDYARIHVGARSHLVSQRMRALESLLAPQEFVRTHRSVIVNTRRVRELHREPDGSGTLVTQDGVRLRVARGRWDALQQALGVAPG